MGTGNVAMDASFLELFMAHPAQVHGEVCLKVQWEKVVGDIGIQ